ncbi:pilus assembly protein TadG-related protein [Microcella alkaliphila]|nr:pilus assembly protein TadG-related protein [Microcella alkaliphila]
MRRRARATSPRASRMLADDTGSILPLIAGYAALGLVVVLLVSAATSLYLERKRLFTLADGAALVGAESFDLDAVRAPDGSLRPRLDDAGVARDVSAYLSEAPTSGFEALRLVAARTPDGVSAEVTLEAAWRPPVVTLFVPEGLTIEVTATARSVLQ